MHYLKNLLQTRFLPCAEASKFGEILACDNN